MLMPYHLLNIHLYLIISNWIVYGVCIKLYCKIEYSIYVEIYKAVLKFEYVYM